MTSAATLTTKDVATLLLSLAAVAISFYNLWAARERDRRDERRRALELVNLQGVVIAQMMSWSADVIRSLSETVAFFRFGPEQAPPTQRAELWAALSSLVDRGRFYFPNRVPDMMRTDLPTSKPDAYRGLRHESLEMIMRAVRFLAAGASLPEDVAIQVEIAQRRFVGIVFAEIDARNRQQQWRELLIQDAGTRASSGGGS